ncbi:MAG: CmpA/NrtA family ABC transporter substrate-binding protein, partial [Pseudomonadota bacterium]
PLVVAHEKGFAAAEGLTLDLIRETSWANIRDRLIVGHFDAAHMLAGLPLAATLGLNGLTVPMAAPLALGRGGNAVTVSQALYAALEDAAGADPARDPIKAGHALAKVVQIRKKQGQTPFVLGIVYPFSSHNYELRYWLAASGVNPDHDVRLVVVPPPFLPAALEAGHVDGFCVGEPWNSVAVAKADARILLTKADIWAGAPEKVLGFRADWVDANGDETTALLRSVQAASLWAGDPANRAELAALLARSDYLDQDDGLIAQGLEGRLPLKLGGEASRIEGFLAFGGPSLSFPWVSQALWLYSQMVRWGQTADTPAARAKVASCFRPDLFRLALKDAGFGPVPDADKRIEGAAVPEHGIAAIFDGIAFDPEALDAYLAGSRVTSG